MTTKEKLIAFGAEKLADVLLSLYESDKATKKQIENALAALEENPKKIISLIKKEISALKKSKKFVNYYESNDVAQRLNQTRLNIVSLSEKSAKEAKELMLEFLNLHKQTLERCDDSNGEISEVFKMACADFGKIWQQNFVSINDSVEFVFANLTKNEYGIYDEIISNFKDTLQDEGLKLLQEKVEKSFDPNSKNLLHHLRTVGALKNIADCQKDIQAYIKACSFRGKMSENDKLEIAKRFIANWQGEEALKWLQEFNSPNHHWLKDLITLKIQALELCGEHEKAQEERIGYFKKTLSVETYNEILKHAQAGFHDSFKNEAIIHAFGFSEPHLALHFLLHIHELEALSKFIFSKIEQLSGSQYYTLRPAADLLCDVYPLAATLLYRKMLEEILKGAKSKYYNYAAKDVVLCQILNERIKDWQNFKNHEIYFKEIQLTHKKKLAFWAEFTSALQKRAAKEQKKAKSL